MRYDIEHWGPLLSQLHQLLELLLGGIRFDLERHKDERCLREVSSPPAP